ncbi:MAG: endolytic transglycosylase MltG [Armatimonadetes bacterium]|nr:endolytic transglycosylase MltG [Armatimonadota bacterium]
MKAAKVVGVLFGLGLVGIGVGYYYLTQGIAPTKKGSPEFIKLDKGETFRGALTTLKSRGIISSSEGFERYAKLTRQVPTIHPGIYKLRPGMTFNEVLNALKQPIHRNLRIPEGWWIERTAKLLEQKNVCSSQEYTILAHRPDEFRDMVDFPLPANSLEGYLFPDTYDIPPHLGARAVIVKQLQTFQAKAWPVLKKTKHPQRTMTIASLVELEVAAPPERPIVAGLIENRLKRSMRLQIDATVLYALKQWKVLGPGEVNKVESPYNTYRIPGLPPGPIGSPSLASIKAAAKPEATPFLFYVAKPDRTHLFSTDYSSHLANIRKARALAASQGKSG